MRLPTYMTHSDCRRWLLWQSVPQENSKPKKIPYYASGEKRNGTLDSAEDFAQLVSFDEARSVLSQGKYTGLGFALGLDENGGYWQGIDFDDVSNKPKLLSLIASLPGYVETSPSQNGVHAIGYGCKFGALGSNKSGIEAYSSKRYFTVTGDNALYDSSEKVEDLSGFIEQSLKPIHTKNSSLSLTSSSASNTMVVDEHLINRLFDALGYISSDDYGAWIAVGHALKALSSIGFKLWSEWSAKSEKFKGDLDLKRWDGFKGERTSYTAIFVRAYKNGWRNPLYDVGLDKQDTAEKNNSLSWIEVSISDLLTNPTAPPQFIVDSLLPFGVVTLLTAHGGTGKSMLALQMAVCVATGFPFMGKPTIQSKVLFFSAEDSGQIVRHRLGCICQEKKIDPIMLAEKLLIIDSTENPELYITQKDKILTDGYEALLKRSVTYGAGLIVIDNASDTFDSNENERPRVREFIRFLTQLAKLQKAAVLLLAHIDKESAKWGSKESYSGSTAWHNSVRSRLFLSLEKDSPILSLIHQKSNFGQLTASINMRRGKYGILYFFDTPSDEEASSIVLSLIEKYHNAGTYISAAPKSPLNPYKVLHKDPDFPHITRKQLEDILQNLLTQKRLIIEIYQSEHRKERKRYRSAPSAPTSDITLGADAKTVSPCSAPSTTGGMGEERAEFITEE